MLRPLASRTYRRLRVAPVALPLHTPAKTLRAPTWHQVCKVIVRRRPHQQPARPRRAAGSEAATVIHRGALWDIPGAVVVLLRWAVENGYESAGFLREYHWFGRELEWTHPGEVVLELQLPVRPATVCDACIFAAIPLDSDTVSDITLEPTQGTDRESLPVYDSFRGSPKWPTTGTA